MSHYTWHNVIKSLRVTTRHAFATLSCIAEISIFVYVGMDALDIEKWRFVSDILGTLVLVSLILLALVLVGREAFVFPLSFLSNLAKKNPTDKINLKQQIVIWWAGLMRGAVSMALAYNQFTRSGHTQLRANAIMITSTITVVLFSTFGLLTNPLIRFLLSHLKHIATTVILESSSPKSITAPLLEGGQDSFDLIHDILRPSSIQALLTTPTHTVHYYWCKFHDAFMRPMFGGRGFVPFVLATATEHRVT
ncbi:LOW QUALITY PROTEIN: Na_H_Exchanger domain-containing protein [Cephalotus follicularis]|uniref:Na_H_Exchanger domain-containing protein n=1 Tax=Cephalotus follicularis TaxID=3775 RepID=A0A1Q3D3K3_CEPFO|nr:LOW QUALITY PROTEIN: Na_H_Exchanger domain-containing protein [Cephalotus follicularis]